MNPSFAPKIDWIYREDGAPDYSSIADVLGVSQEVLARILDVSESTLRNKRVSASTLGKTTALIHILNMLWDLSGQNKGQIRRFMHEPRQEWGGVTPILLLSSGRSAAVAKFLEGLIDGDPIS